MAQDPSWKDMKLVISCEYPTCIYKFSLKRFRHRCKICGGVFCDLHVPHRYPVEDGKIQPLDKNKKNHKVCITCLHDYEEKQRPYYVETLPIYFPVEHKDLHPLFPWLEGRDVVRIVQLGGKGSIMEAVKETANIVNSAEGLAEGDFPDPTDDGGGGDDGGKSNKKIPTVVYNYQVYLEDWTTQIMDVTTKIKSKKGKTKIQISFSELKKGKALINCTCKGAQYSVKIGKINIADIRKHPNEATFMHEYQVINTEIPAQVLFDVHTTAIAEFSKNYKLCAPNTNLERIGRIQREFKAVHIWKDGCNVYKINFPKFCSLDVKAMVLAMALVLDVEEYAATGSFLQKTGVFLSGAGMLVGSAVKIAKIVKPS